MELLINNALRRLGITANYRGHRQLAIAVQLVLEDEDRLYAVQQEIYRPVAEIVQSNPGSVERNIRTVIARVWNQNRAQLNAFAGYEMTEPPKPSEFIDIIANRVRRSCSVH